MSEDVVESVAVQELEVDEQLVPEKPAEPIIPPDVNLPDVNLPDINLPDIKPSPTEVMRHLTADRVLAKATQPTVAQPKAVLPETEPPKTVPVEVPKPVVEPVPQVASVAQEYVEAQRSDNKPPRYPKKERRLSREGKVTVRVSIAVSGAVTGVSVLEESRYEGFNREARKAAHKWKFKPAMRGGVAVVSEIDIEVVFRLTDPE